MLLPTCVVLLHVAHTFDVSVLYVHVVFDDKHAMHAGVCVCFANLYIYQNIPLSNIVFSVFWCPFQHGLYKCTCTQHTVAHCILS